MVNRALQSYAFFLGLTFIMLLLLSPDSFLYDIYGKCDSSCFYVDGKAWMNGLTPYVDFYDVKGPLLFLFYGIGYLISPHNYLGEFYISVFWYAWILFFTQKMAKVFLISYWKAWTASALMLLVYLNPLIHWEFRAEDICTLFVVISLYEMCKMCGVSTLEYFKEFFKAIMQGRTDYENMLPMTIGIKKL